MILTIMLYLRIKSQRHQKLATFASWKKKIKVITTHPLR